MAHHDPLKQGRVASDRKARATPAGQYGSVQKSESATYDRAAESPHIGEQVTSLRERLEEQLRQWQAEVDGLEYLTDAMQVEALNRAHALLAVVKAQLRCWDVYTGEAEGQDQQGGQMHPTYDSMLTQLRRWGCALAELRAMAYKADVQARHTHQQQVSTLKAGVDAVTHDWQHELARLHVPASMVMTPQEVASLVLTRRKLCEWDDIGTCRWPGFTAAVESVLDQVDQYLRQAITRIPTEQLTSNDYAALFG